MQTSVDNSCGFATLLCLGIGQQLQLSTAAERCWWKLEERFLLAKSLWIFHSLKLKNWKDRIPRCIMWSVTFRNSFDEESSEVPKASKIQGGRE